MADKNYLDDFDRLKEGYVYPATLGAALAWEVQAFANWWTTGTDRPLEWSLLFGLWFIVYHSLWYWHLLRHENAGGPLTVATDLLDAVLLLAAFWALAFASGKYAALASNWVFLVVLGLTISGLIANARRINGWGWGWFAVAILACVVGARAQWETPGTIGGWAWTVQVTLWVVLAAYALSPALFGSSRTAIGGVATPAAGTKDLQAAVERAERAAERAEKTAAVLAAGVQAAAPGLTDPPVAP
jgi:hypothetical protein